jgi:hypothetical protein
MSVLSTPNPTSTIVGRTGAFVADWYRYMRDIRRILGCDDSAPIYREVAIEACGMGLVGTASLQAITGATAMAISCPDAATSGVAFNVRLPRELRSGAYVQPWVDWTSTVAAGAVRWRFVGSTPVGKGDVIADSYSEYGTEAFDGTARKIHRFSPAAYTVTADRGDTVLCEVLRYGAHGDDSLGGAALIVAAGVTVQIDGVGNEVGTP